MLYIGIILRRGTLSVLLLEYKIKFKLAKNGRVNQLLNCCVGGSVSRRKQSRKQTLKKS